MPPSASCKPDLDQTIARFAAWWQGDVLDRPPITMPVAVAPDAAAEDDGTPPSCWRTHWLDVAARTDQSIARLLAQPYPLDNLPLFMANIGPELTGTLYGCELVFGPHTSWSQPIVHERAQWHAILEREPDFDNIYFQHIEAMQQRAIQACQGRYLIGLPDLHGNYDILASLREPADLCMDLIDDPDLMHRVAMHVARGYGKAFERLYAPIRAMGQGSSTWAPFYHDGPAYLPSCDFWCLISDALARSHMLPAIVAECEPLERTLFHLDGPQALRHLELLLEQPCIDAIQWVYGAGAGPASRWIEVYQRVRAAGRSVQVLAESLEDAACVLKALGPQGVWITLETLQAGVTAEQVEKTLIHAMV